MWALSSALILLLAAPSACTEQDDNATIVYTPPQVDGLHWSETFDGDVWSRWTQSKKEKYNGEFKVEGRAVEAITGDMGLVVPDPAQHYGVSAAFPAVVGKKDVSFAVQFEVRFQAGLSCGGSYIKLFDSAGKSADEFDNDTPYVIMFGPDKCGGTNKVHFILKHQNPKSGVWEEKHFKDAPGVPSDTLTHLYGFIIRPDNSIEIQIDGVSKASGDLLSSMEPPVNPPEEIDDAEDSKPKEWVDNAKMDDPESSKPDDWDEDAPARIPDASASMPAGWNEDAEKRLADPSSKRPEDWDDEEDGEWEAPMIDNPDCSVGCGKWAPPMLSNPAYKGKWHAPKIDNPQYKGEWNPRKIANPDYFNDETPCVLPKIDSVGIDIWTMDKSILFDNFVVATDEAHLKSFADQSWKIRHEREQLQTPKEGGSVIQRIYDFVEANFVVVVVAVVGLFLSVVLCYWCCSDRKPKKAKNVAKKEAKATNGDAKAPKEDKDVADSKEEDQKEEKANEEKEVKDEPEVKKDK